MKNTLTFWDFIICISNCKLQLDPRTGNGITNEMSGETQDKEKWVCTFLRQLYEIFRF